MANVTTIKLDADISGLRKGIQEANRQIKLANAEFKAASSGMDNWSKSTDGIQKKLTQLKTVMGNQEQILKAYEAQLKEVVKEQGENSKGADELRIKIENQKAAINNTANEIKKFTNELNNLENEQKQAEDAAGKTETAYDSLQKEIQDQESELKKLKSEYANVILEQGENSDSAKDLANQIDSLSSELADNKRKMKDAEDAADNLDNSLEDVGDSAEKTEGGLSVFSVALGNLVANVISDAIQKMKDLVVETINVGKTFDSSMSQVGAVSGATGDELQALRDKAKEMGSTTKFTASEAADAFNYMAMAGWKTEDMINGVDGVLQLAAASGSDLATTSDIVTDALTAMGYSAGDAGRLADVMAAASSNANTNVEMMGHTFQYAAPIIGAMGYSMEDAAKQIGLMANAGIKADKAGTALRSILTRLAAPPKECASAMEALGISLTDSEGNMKSLDEVMGDLRQAFSGLSETQQTQYAKGIAGQEAMSGLLAIVNAAPEDVDKLTEAINNSNGAAEKMANTMLNNLGGDMTLLQSKMEGVQLAIYEKFEPALRAGVDILSKLLDGVQFVVDHSAEFTAALAAMATALASYLAFSTALKVMKDGWMALTVVTKAQAAAQAILNAVTLLSPWMWVVTGIMALVAAFVVLWNKSDKFREFWINLWNVIKEKASAAISAIGKFFGDLWSKIQNVWSTVSTWFMDKVITPLVNFFTEMKETIGGIFSAIWNKIVEIFGPAVQWYINLYTSIFEALKSIITVIIGLMKGTWNTIKIIWGVAYQWFNSKVITPIKDAFSKFWNTLSSAGKKTWTSIKNVWTSVSGWFKEKIISPVQNAFNNMWTKLKSGAKNAWDGVKSVFGGVADWFRNKFSDAWQKVKNVFSTGGKVFDGIKDGIVNSFKTVVNAIIRGINKVIKIPFDSINSMLNKIRNISVAGAKPFDGLWKQNPLSVPQIPLLATGGVLKKGQVGLLEGNGAEAVVPLENNKKWIAKTAKDLKTSLENEGLVGAGTNSNVVNNYNFNQTNNSPKPLNRLEIYRQTKNQIAFAKGV